MNKPKRSPLPITALMQVYPFIQKFYKKYGFMPTAQEIGDEFGKTSEWARFCLKALVRAKRIKVTRYTHRGIKLL